MVFEAMSHDLTGLMESEYSKHFSQGQVKCYMQQLFEALNYCHRNGILHRDIKCDAWLCLVSSSHNA